MNFRRLSRWGCPDTFVPVFRCNYVTPSAHVSHTYPMTSTGLFIGDETSVRHLCRAYSKVKIIQLFNETIAKYMRVSDIWMTAWSLSRRQGRVRVQEWMAVGTRLYARLVVSSSASTIFQWNCSEYIRRVVQAGADALRKQAGGRVFPPSTWAGNAVAGVWKSGASRGGDGGVARERRGVRMHVRERERERERETRGGRIKKGRKRSAGSRRKWLRRSVGGWRGEKLGKRVRSWNTPGSSELGRIRRGRGESPRFNTNNR